MDNHTSETPLKKCTKCKQEFLATAEFFNRDKNRKDGLNPQCKICAKAGVQRWLDGHPDYRKEYSRKYYAEHRFEILKKQKEYSKKNAIKISIRRKQKRLENPELTRQLTKEKYWRNRDKNLERGRNYRSKNKTILNARRREKRLADPEKYRKQKMDWYFGDHARILKRRREKYHKNPEPILRQQREYNARNRDQRSAASRDWVRRNPHIARATKRRHYDRKHGLLNDWTPEQWKHAINYFNGCCAVCGRQLTNLFGDVRVNADHWIPVSSPDCPGTTRKNIVPLCAGIDGCNNRKSGKNAEVWLVSQFGKRKAKQILKRIQGYFDSLH